MHFTCDPIDPSRANTLKTQRQRQTKRILRNGEEKRDLGTEEAKVLSSLTSSDSSVLGQRQMFLCSAGNSVEDLNL